ncbi:hypothetical protein PUN28_003263 [Cardiocondyla obscurior]|uniref:Secreted protein n=1 Tax=Cardiocondyla obscurior TaxID=286306 RepID=A0AAW2GK53_9HYME
MYEIFILTMRLITALRLFSSPRVRHQFVHLSAFYRFARIPCSSYGARVCVPPRYSKSDIDSYKCPLSDGTTRFSSVIRGAFTLPSDRAAFRGISPTVAREKTGGNFHLNTRVLCNLKKKRKKRKIKLHGLAMRYTPHFRYTPRSINITR